MEDICVCKVCGKTISRKNFSQHLSLHNGDDHQCEICLKSFKTNIYLKKHLKTHDNPISLQYEKCEKCFQSKEAVSKHMKTKHENVKYICSYCSTSLTSKYMLFLNLLEKKNICATR